MRNLLIIVLCLPFLTFSQQHFEDVLAYQNDLKQFYVNPDTTPLNTEELKSFSGIDFFPFSTIYRVKARFKKLEGEKKFKMPSTGKMQQWYKKYAELTFTVNGKECKLFVYQNLEYSKYKEHEKSLFLPFLDATNGESTYGGGRYLDVEIPETDFLLLDFNKAYHPYCAYAAGYSCPIVPQENTLNVKIEAGVKLRTDEN